jgi:hypothetical protein
MNKGPNIMAVKNLFSTGDWSVLQFAGEKF